MNLRTAVLFGVDYKTDINVLFTFSPYDNSLRKSLISHKSKELIIQYFVPHNGCVPFHLFKSSNYIGYRNTTQYIIVMEIVPTIQYCNVLQEPQWVCDTRIFYQSAYDFASYSVDEEVFTVIPRGKNEPKVLASYFVQDSTPLSYTVYYVICRNNPPKQSSSTDEDHLYLCTRSAIIQKQVFILKNTFTQPITTVKFVFVIENKKQALILLKSTTCAAFFFVDLLNDTHQNQLQPTQLTQQIQVFHSLYNIQGQVTDVIHTQQNSCLILINQCIILVEIDYQRKGMQIKWKQLLEYTPSKIQCGRILNHSYFVFLSQPNYIELFLYNSLKILRKCTTKLHSSEQKSQNKQYEMVLNNNILLIWSIGSKQVLHYKVTNNLESNEQSSMLQQGICVCQLPPLQFEIGCPILYLRQSPSNTHILVVTKSRKQQQFVFQYSIYCQIAAHDTSILTLAVPKMQTKGAIVQLMNSLGEVYVQSCGLLYTPKNELIGGVTAFSIHPLGHFMAVGVDCIVKVYGMDLQRLAAIHSISQPSVRKILFSPLGADLCLLSSKVIKIYDAYSFGCKHSLADKSTPYLTAVYFKQYFYALGEHTLTIYSSDLYVPLHSIRIMVDTKEIPLQILVNEQYQIIILLCKGSIMIKNQQAETVLRYRDDVNITSFAHDRKVLVNGCSNGRVRIHQWPISIDEYEEVCVGYCAVTAVAIKDGVMYAGDCNGALSIVKINEPSLECNTPFVLCSRKSIVDDPAEKLRLDYKLGELVTKLNDQIQEKKKVLKKQFNEQTHINKLLCDEMCLNSEIESNKRNVKQLLVNGELEYASEREKLKQQQFIEEGRVAEVKVALIYEKSALLLQFQQNKQQQVKRFEKQCFQERQRQAICEMKLQLQQREIENDLSEVYRQFLQCTPPKQMQQNELSKEQLQYCQLQKRNSYLQSAIEAMRDAGAKHATEEYRMNLTMNEGRLNLQSKHSEIEKLREQLVQVDRRLNNPGFNVLKSNAVYRKVAQNGDMDDACSYKLWVKNKMEVEVEQCYEYYRKLEELLQQKRNEVISQFKENRVFDKKNQEMGVLLTCRSSRQKEIAFRRNKVRRKCWEGYQSMRSSPDKFSKEGGREQTDRFQAVEKVTNQINNKYREMKNGINIHRFKTDRYFKENDVIVQEYELLKEDNVRLMLKQKECQQLIEQIIYELKDKGPKIQFKNKVPKDTNYQKYLQKNKKRLSKKHCARNTLL